MITISTYNSIEVEESTKFVVYVTVSSDISMCCSVAPHSALFSMWDVLYRGPQRLCYSLPAHSFFMRFVGS